MCIGLNCGLGAKAMAPFLKRLADVAECFVHAYANAGLPNAMGGYDDTPEDLARENLIFAEMGLVNMVGGCCGTTPPHIKRSSDHRRAWLQTARAADEDAAEAVAVGSRGSQVR